MANIILQYRPAIRANMKIFEGRHGRIICVPFDIGIILMVINKGYLAPLYKQRLSMHLYRWVIGVYSLYSFSVIGCH